MIRLPARSNLPYSIIIVLPEAIQLGAKTMPLLTGNQLRAARALANVDQQYVASAAGVNVNTIRNMEGRGFDAITSGVVNVRRVEECLEALGIDFLDGKDPGVTLRRIWGKPSGNGVVEIHRDGTFLLAAPAHRVREMAENAELRGDTLMAVSLREAADRAESEKKPDFSASNEPDRVEAERMVIERIERAISQSVRVAAAEALLPKSEEPAGGHADRGEAARMAIERIERALNDSEREAEGRRSEKSASRRDAAGPPAHGSGRVAKRR
jgi:hypothetical protein